MGAIIIGYQGIGKSTTTSKYLGKYIDLESSCFKDDNGIRHDDWYVSYCNVAWDLAKQGYRVFVSSHDVVRQRLGELSLRDNDESDIHVLIAHPSIQLKDEWIARLETRYNSEPTTKNKLALLNAVKDFEYNQHMLYKSCSLFGFDEIEINDINYSLDALINNVLDEYNGED